MNEGEVVWVAGQVLNFTSGAWEIIGVFNTEQKAIEACVGLNDFVGPLKLNEIAPRQSVDWVGAYYPLMGKMNGQ